MIFPSKEIVENLREKYPTGCRVGLIRIDNPYNKKLRPGCMGTVKFVDDTGTIHVAWDCGSSLGVVYGEDICKRIYEEVAK